MFKIIYYNPILKKNESMQIEASNKKQARLKFKRLWSLPIKIVEVK